ncbi:MAG: glycosyltransferase family 4 protein [Woeseiaceae bacterium]
MKIALIVPGGVDPAGVRVIPVLLTLIRRLARDHDVHVFATHQEPTPGGWLLEGAQIHNLGLPRTAWRAIKALSTEHRKAPFQVIHSIWAGSSGALATCAGKLLRVPSVVHVAGGELVAFADINYGGCLTWRRRLLQSSVLKFATRVTAPSEAICDLVAKRGVQAQRLPLGVDLERWPPRHPVGRHRDEQPQLVHVASLNRVKDQPTLLRALRLLADRDYDFQVNIVGEDTLNGDIQAMSRDVGLGHRVQFHGYLTHDRLRPVIEAAHVALISSRHEAGPLALLEAAVAGVPTVGTAVGHIAEWSPNAAIAVPCEDPAALADAIQLVLDDEDLRMRLANEALRRASQMDADQTALAYNHLYQQLLCDK